MLAVIAHNGKTLGGGLAELRAVLAAAGHAHPLWYEVSKSRKARKAVRKALHGGATQILVWGGDGMVQRCIDALDGARVPLGIVPAGTANLLAHYLGLPRDVAGAVQIALHGSRRKLDVGVVNGERFAVMAGTGLDALIMRAVDGARKRQLGRLAYVRAGVRAARARRVRVHVRVDGNDWFEGLASAVLIGNIGTMTGGLTAFPQASPSDGLLEIGVVTAKSAWEWLRVLSRTVGGRPDHSRFVELSRGKKIVIELSRKRPYELDGGVRKPKKRLKIHLEPAALTVCVPRAPSRPKPTPPPRRRARLPPR